MLKLEDTIELGSHVEVSSGEKGYVVAIFSDLPYPYYVRPADHYTDECIFEGDFDDFDDDGWDLCCLLEELTLISS